MTDEIKKTSADDPAGGHDPAALQDAADKMGIQKVSERKSDDEFDPDGPHDPEALEDAERKMAVKRPE